MAAPASAGRSPSGVAAGEPEQAAKSDADGGRILALNLDVGAVSQNALDHRGDLRRRTALELRENAGRALFDMPLDHHATTAIADMPFRHQVAVPSAELLGVRRAGRPGFAPDGGVADSQCCIGNAPASRLERAP